MKRINALIAPLSLVYHPFTNQEAIWLAEDRETIDRLRRSDIYMIAARAQATFGDFRQVQVAGRNLLEVKIRAGDVTDTFNLDIEILLADRSVEIPFWNTCEIEIASNGIRLWIANDLAPDAGADTLVEFFTPEKLIYERGLEMPGLGGLDRIKEFSIYELLYVGIAKESDTFERLIGGSHEARQRILGSEFPRSVGARVSDEIVFLAFDIEHFSMRGFGDSGVPSNDSLGAVRARDKAVTADAEKAFIKMLDPVYNKAKYARYPAGEDGLYSAGLTSYGFVITENITLETSSAVFSGATRAWWRGNEQHRMFVDGGDVITVVGDEVIIYET